MMETLRKLIQILATFLTNSYFLFPFTKTIYQGPLKVICSPGLNCYSCPASTTYCPIGSIQQLLLSIRFSLESGSIFFGSYAFGSIGLIGAISGRFTCGWLCPFGLFQELLYKIPSGKTKVYNHLKYVKYFILIFFVIVFPLFIVDEFDMGSPWFCKYICPAGTLEAGLPMLWLQPDLRQIVGVLFYNKLTILILFTIWSISASRPFCKTICPLGAFYGLFNKISLFRLKLNDDKCTNCGTCLNVCPMDIQFNLTPNSPECIQCLRCIKEGCKFDAITINCAMIQPVKSSLKKTSI